MARYCSMYNFTQLIQECTRITNNSKSLIDHIYVNNEQHVKEINVPKMVISDHFAVCMTWKKQGLISVNQAKNIISYRDKKHFNSDLFVDDLITFTNLDDNLESVDTMVKNLKHTFLETLDKHAPVKQKRIKHHVQPTWFNKDIKECIIYRDRAKQKMDHNNYRILRNKVVNMIKKAKSQHYHSICKSKGNSKLLWQQM